MSYAPRPTMSAATAAGRPTLSGALPGGSTSGGSQSTVLQNRIAEKRAELDNLKQLRDLSAAVATQMEALEQKLATLSDGTEGKSQELSSRRQVAGSAGKELNED